MTKYTLDLPIVETDIEHFMPYMCEMWEQGDHIVIIGPTKSGKTTLASYLLDCRSYVVVLALKPKDETLEFFKRRGYKVYRTFPPNRNDHKIILWLAPEQLSDFKKQRLKILTFLNQAYKSGGWTVYLDEAGLVSGELHLGSETGRLLNQGRSLGLTIVAVTTRPTSVVARIPVEVVTQVKYKIIFRPEPREIKAISVLTGLSEDFLVYLIQDLDKHDFFVIEHNERIIIVRFTDEI